MKMLQMLPMMLMMRLVVLTLPQIQCCGRGLVELTVDTGRPSHYKVDIRGFDHLHVIYSIQSLSKYLHNLYVK